MRSSKLRRDLCGCVVAMAAALAGCGGDGGGPVPVPGTGTLTVTWTIEGVAAPSQCDAFAIDHLELNVYERGVSAPFTTVNAPCEDFALTVELPDGIYDASATLIDPSGVDASETLPLNDLDIVAGTDLTSDIDFPAGSIF